MQATLIARADQVIEYRRLPFMALFGHRAMSELSPLCDQKRT